MGGEQSKIIFERIVLGIPFYGYNNIKGRLVYMALFGDKKTKEEKELEQMERFMAKYQLEDLDEKDLVVLQRIASDLAGNNFFKVGMALSFAKAEEQAKVTYLSTLVEQNWMIIRQLSRLNKNIEGMKTSE